MATDNMTASEVLAVLNRSFPKEQIKTRKGAWDSDKKAYVDYIYVPSQHVLERLHEAFGLDLIVKVPGMDRPIADFIAPNSKKEPTVVVPVILEWTDEKGKLCTSPGFGGKVVTSDLGNDFKSALSKAISNAAKKWGVALDLAEDDEDEGTPEGAPQPGVGIAPNIKTDKEKEATSTVAAAEKPKSGVQINVASKNKDANEPPPDEAPAVVENDDAPPPEAPVKGRVIELGGKKGSDPAEKTTETVKKAVEVNLGSKDKGEPAKDETKGAESGKKASTVQIGTKKSEPAKTEPSGASTKGDLKCQDCSNDIVAAQVSSEGAMMEPHEIVNVSQTFFEKDLCSRCLKAARKKKLDEQQEAETA